MLIIFCRVTLKDIKIFLSRVHCKISTNKLRELFQEVDTRKRNELNFDEFVTLYDKLIYNPGVKNIFCYYIFFVII
jgi:phosphatidylinositol phospholipase C gamma-1